MSTLDEVLGAKTSFAADAATGVQVLSDMGTVVFDLYNRTVLPLDGYVFWVRSADPETSITVPGSFHYDTEFRQDESNNYAATKCVFTALTEVNDLRDVAPGQCYIATMGENLVFAFSSRGYFYKTADLFHYRGFATYNDVLTQVVPNGTDLLAGEPIVSNSLPIWLLMNTYTAVYGFEEAGVTLFPSFLIPDNEEPPFASVHVIPDTTQAIGGSPRLTTAPPAETLVSLVWSNGVVTATTSTPHGITTPAALLVLKGTTPGGYGGRYACTITGASTFTYKLTNDPGAATVAGTWQVAGSTPGTRSDQLIQERVRVTFYGLRNEEILNFVNFVNQFTTDNVGILGVMNQPTNRDEKRTQPELRVLGQKKIIEYQVNYYQNAVFDIAQQLIKEAAVSFTPQ